MQRTGIVFGFYCQMPCHGGMQRSKTVGLNQIVQCCDVTESYQPFGGFAKEGELQCLYEVYLTVSASTAEKSFTEYGGNKEAAKKIGQIVAERCKAKGIETVVFDRGGYVFHGRVKEHADGAREGGLQF